MRKLAWLALALAACHRAPATVSPPPPPPDNVVPDDPPPVYAALFERGAVWTFHVEQLDSDFDETGAYVDQVEQLELRCKVADVERRGDVELSEVTCDEGWPSTSGTTPVAGLWAMTSRGLWSLWEWPEGERPTLEGDPIIGAPPIPWSVTDTADGEAVSEAYLEQRGDAWCWGSRGLQGDSYWSSVCFGPGGPTEGTYGWAGAAEHSASFTRTD